MPGVPAARRKPPKSRSRPNRLSHSHSAAQDGVGNDGPPPKKKLKYIPGGPGGGGRYVDTDGTEIPVGGTGPGGYAYAGPRGPVGRANAANGVQPPVYERPRRESRRERPAPRTPRYSSAAAAAAAVVQGDGFKPREERSWEEFHQDLDIEAKFPVFRADEVDGIVRPESSVSPLPQSPNGAGTARMDSTDAAACSIQLGEYKESFTNGVPMGTPMKLCDSAEPSESPSAEISTLRRRPGRPPRRQDSMLKGIGTPETPKIVPLPGPNPREKLTLPKPSFRRVDPFISYEVKAAAQNFVDRTMASVGYQESDIYIRPEKKLIRVTEGSLEDDLDVVTIAREKESNLNISMGALSVGRVEYDMDEQDQRWLDDYNARRKDEQVEPVKPAIFEIIMTKIEKEWHSLEKRIPKPNPKPPQTHRPRSSSAAAVNGETHGIGEEQDSKCAICDDGDCENTNAIVFCDGCDLAVHQECYGVPYIPEGQWLCRKCQLIGRGTPTCIFCPNIEGAFKQTNSSKWSHLLCAIWIPEVSLGNPTFMEPVMDVEKVPKQRWKLTCYICHQRMGACIQCGNKNCFVAFHVTCARRARLFLQMKSSHGGPASFDSNLLKAYCDKHVPNDWRKDNNVDNAIEEAKTYYRRTMRHRVWADSQQSAMNITMIQDQPPPEPIEEENKLKISLTFGNKKRNNRNPPPKTIWKTSAGAPVIPAVVYELVEDSCNRLTVRKRKPFAEDMCKYWTLKREARRGAALLKRLQLQMETFSSMEMTRRNFAGMGAAGRVRLDRRIEFADQLLEDVERLKKLCNDVKVREHDKLRDAEMLRDIIDTVYFPIPPLLWPIIDKAQALDGKKTFYDGLAMIRERMEQRFYTSVSTFSADLTAVFSAGIGINHMASPLEAQSHIIGDSLKKGLTPEQKEKKKLAKRIIKAVQPALEDAMRKESELYRKPFEKELQDMDLNLLLEASISSRRDSMAVSAAGYVSEEEPEVQKQIATNGLSGRSSELTLGSPVKSMGAGENEMEGAEYRNIANGTANEHEASGKEFNNTRQTPMKGMPVHQPTPEDSNTTPSAADLNYIPEAKLSHTSAPQAHVPPTPPLSSGGDHQTPLSNGGVPWYMEPFDPTGTTIQEERWTGREVTRAMSEELSDMEEEELSGLVEEDFVETNSTAESGDVMQVSVGGTEATVKANSNLRKSGKQKKRWKGFK